MKDKPNKFVLGLSSLRDFKIHPFMHDYDLDDLALIWLWATALNEFGEDKIITNDQHDKLTKQLLDVHDLLPAIFRWTIPKEHLGSYFERGGASPFKWTRGFAGLVLRDVEDYLCIKKEKKEKVDAEVKKAYNEYLQAGQA